MAEWFEEWFGEEYLALYPHRDEEDAARAVALIRSAVPWREGWRTLDVACGPGRHLRALAAAGASPIGLDLSMVLLRRARDVSPAPLVRGDMRALPIRPRSIDLAVNLFTSFGYFDDDADHAIAIAEMVRTVRPGGWFVLDFLHASTVRAHLVERDYVRDGGTRAAVSRRLSADGRYVAKTIRTEDGRQFLERVRLFEPPELVAMLEAAGVTITATYGDYDGGPLVTGSPRAIAIGTVR